MLSGRGMLEHSLRRRILLRERVRGSVHVVFSDTRQVHEHNVRANRQGLRWHGSLQRHLYWLKPRLRAGQHSNFVWQRKLY